MRIPAPFSWATRAPDRSGSSWVLLSWEAETRCCFWSVAGVVFVNGATGLLKMALLRFFRIGIFRGVRYPLHDHARQNLKWSNTQVLMRFVLLQALGAPLLLLLILKIR